MILIIATQIKFFVHSYPYKINTGATYALIGSTLTAAKRYNQAYFYLKEGTALPPDSSSYLVYYHLASYYYLTGDVAQAIENFKKSIEFNPANYRAYNELGFIYKMNGEFDTAISYFNRTIAIVRAFPLAYLNLADCYIGLKDWTKVVSALESYNHTVPSPSPIIDNALGNLYMDLFQDWQKASHHFERAIKYQQGLEISAETYNRLGSCYYYLKRSIKAREAWLWGLKIDPHYQPIKQNLELLENND